MSRDLPERPWFLPETREIDGFAVVSVLRSAGKTLSLSVVDQEGRPFAMKIPVKENASDPTWMGRFEREVQILRQLVGPAFPTLRAFGKYTTEEHKEIPYLVTSVPIGPTLKEIIAQRRAMAARPDVAGAPLLLRSLAEALSEVHEKGFVHRNLRPDKIAVAGGRIQILDFILGLASVVDDLTRANEFLGTPDYIAPEQIRSPHNVDARADLYSLGLILFEYLTYDRPFGQGTTGVEAFLRHVTQDAPPPSSVNPEVPRDLDRLLLRLLQRERGERFQSAQEVIVAVDELLQARRGQALSHLCLMPESGRIGSYRVSEAIGTIGKTLHIRVEDGKGRPFAMKIPSRQGLQDEGYLLRFEREVGLLREVAGPSFPLLRASGTYEACGHKHVPYMVTDLPAGKTLREIIDQRRQHNAPPDIQGAPLLLWRLALLLAEVHAKNIFPCNIRPDVVAVREDGVQLLEFLLNQGATSDGVVASGGVSVLASYAAPEQLDLGGRVDARADLYSLGVLFFEYLTHELPYGTSSSRHDALLRLMTQPTSSPSSYTEGIPPALDALVVRLLARDPANRPASARQLAEEVRSLLS
jgi:serine/threonine protein kinase